MKLRWKMLLAIGLGILYSCSTQTHSAASYPKVVGRTSERLEAHYKIMNQDYFSNRLPEDVKIVVVDKLFDENLGRLLGSTICSSPEHCRITVDREMNAAPVTMELTIDHEMCHVESHGKNFDAHGEAFQACMLHLALAGAFREVW